MKYSTKKVARIITRGMVEKAGVQILVVKTLKKSLTSTITKVIPSHGTPVHMVSYFLSNFVAISLSQKRHTMLKAAADKPTKWDF